MIKIKLRALILLGALLYVSTGSAQQLGLQDNGIPSPFTYSTLIQGGVFSNFSAEVSQGSSHKAGIHLTINVHNQLVGNTVRDRSRSPLKQTMPLRSEHTSLFNLTCNTSLTQEPIPNLRTRFQGS